MKITKTDTGYRIEVESGTVIAKDKEDANYWINEFRRIDLLRVNAKYDKILKDNDLEVKK
jgi:hypothetical protein